MIFLTVGTHEPFDRLVRAFDAWCGAQGTPPKAFGQVTARAAYSPKNFPAVATLEPAEYDQRCQEADIIVGHAGMGSIITALSLQKPVVILPRRGHLCETRNDHQFATAERFRTKPGIHVAEDEAALAGALDAVLGEVSETGQEIAPFAEHKLLAALGDFIHMGGND